MNEKEIEDKMRETWNSVPEMHSQAKKEEVWGQFSQEAFPRKRSHKKWLYSGIAAFLVISLTAGILWTGNTLTTENDNLAYTIIKNPSTKIKSVFLPDSSVVDLEPNAELKYSKDFKNNRLLKLTGEAFFKVQKDAEHPFSVSCQETKTTVLGTSFTINGNIEDAVEVNLFEGKVQMTVSGNDTDWILTPGERFIYKNNLVTVEAFNRFQDFNNVELKTVLHYITKTYKYEIQMPPEHLHTKITIRLNKKETLENVIGIIAQMSNLNPTIDENLKIIAFR